ncbi:HNH endonuclease [Bdellovibrio bacteriovorus]|uniref:HNH endonuclease n=1 Tax=Bdellovibrio bacteriovorus TaxID=959 RepID=UPI0021CEA6F9|nr:HNH endonuclease signature motif containing protein [Bdellovibrio bacteriovorus]UXR63972.1 HNH endonuclease [Bdellovibrio bacteriovorus]
MISLNCNFRTPAKFRGALSRAYKLLNNQDVNNIWDNETLRANLSAQDKDDLEEFRKLVKEKLISSFGPYCTYCHWYGTSPGVFHIDHFVIKANKAGLGRFTYCHKNLILSCAACNISKGRKKTFDDNSVIPVTLKYQSLPFIVFHPYLHKAADEFSFYRATVAGKTKRAERYLGMIGYYDERQRRQIMNQLKERRMASEDRDKVRLIISKTRRSRK